MLHSGFHRQCILLFCNARFACVRSKSILDFCVGHLDGDSAPYTPMQTVRFCRLARWNSSPSHDALPRGSMWNFENFKKTVYETALADSNLWESKKSMKILEIPCETGFLQFYQWKLMFFDNWIIGCKPLWLPREVPPWQERTKESQNAGVHRAGTACGETDSKKLDK